jgi:thiol-disulfide isomerase/thioredoxin
LLAATLLATLLLAASTIGAGERPARDVAALHSLAPSFSLPAIEGKPVDLATYRGKVVLLDFWATWCAPCRTTIPRLVKLQARYRDRGVQILGISLDDDPKAVREAYRQFGFNYPVAIGDAALAERYGGILGLPVLFVIGCDGRIEHRVDGETDLALLERQVGTLLEDGHCNAVKRRR